MSVRKESFGPAQFTGGVTAVVDKLVRHAAGGWTFHISIVGEGDLRDGRQIVLNRRGIRVKATEQLGRKGAK